MNAFGDIVGKLAGGAAGQGGASALVTTVLQMLNNHPGGLSGLAEAFQKNGLGEVAASWIGTGRNLPVSADQLQQVLGADQVQAFARKAGLSPDLAGSQLADLLPTIVDRLTPGGQMPQGGDLMSTGMSLLQSLMSGDKPES